MFIDRYTIGPHLCIRCEVLICRSRKQGTGFDRRYETRLKTWLSPQKTDFHDHPRMATY